MSECNNLAAALIVSQDHATAALVTDVLRSVAIAADTCDVDVCPQRVRQGRYELAVVDFTVKVSAGAAVEAIRAAPSMRTAVVIAITPNSEQSSFAFARGVHFVIEHPITRDSLTKIV